MYAGWFTVLGVQVLQDADAAVADGGQENGQVLQLPAILDLKAAAPLTAAFLGRRGTDIVVDAAAVQRLGGQCLQVLLSAQAGWSEDARSMTIENASAQFCSAIELFGAGSALFFNPKEPA